MTTQTIAGLSSRNPGPAFMGFSGNHPQDDALEIYHKRHGVYPAEIRTSKGILLLGPTPTQKQEQAAPIPAGGEYTQASLF